MWRMLARLINVLPVLVALLIIAGFGVLAVLGGAS